MSGVLRWLIPILVVASFLRLFHFQQTPPGLYPDEAMNGNNALEALRTGEFKLYYPENNGREGLMIALQAMTLDIFGVREPWALRAPSPVIGVLTVLGLFFLGRELFSERAGLLAAFLLATSTWHLYFSRMGFRAILAPLLMVWALYFLLASFKAAAAGSGWMVRAIAGGAIFGLGFYSYIAFRMMPLALLAFVPWRRHLPSFWRVAALSMLAAFVVALPIGIFFLLNPGEFVARAGGISVFARPQPITTFFDNLATSIGMLFVSGDRNWRHNYSGAPELFWPVGALLAAGILRGAAAIYRREAGALSYALLLAWSAVALLPGALTTDGIPSAIRSILMLPPLMLMAAEAGTTLHARVARSTPHTWVTVTLAGTFCLALTVHAYWTYFVLYADRPEVQEAFNADYVAIGRAIENLPLQTRKLVVEGADGGAVRGHRMPTQTVMFITDTFDPELAARKNVIYVDPDDLEQVEPGTIFHLK